MSNSTHNRDGGVSTGRAPDGTVQSATSRDGINWFHLEEYDQEGIVMYNTAEPSEWISSELHKPVEDLA